MWTILVLEHRENHTSTHGYAATREEAMAAFAKSWRRLSERTANSGYDTKADAQARLLVVRSWMKRTDLSRAQLKSRLPWAFVLAQPSRPDQTETRLFTECCR
jgi:hypothetical protein